MGGKHFVNSRGPKAGKCKLYKSENHIPPTSHPKREREIVAAHSTHLVVTPDFSQPSGYLKNN